MSTNEHIIEENQIVMKEKMSTVLVKASLSVMDNFTPIPSDPSMNSKLTNNLNVLSMINETLPVYTREFLDNNLHQNIRWRSSLFARPPYDSKFHKDIMDFEYVLRQISEGCRNPRWGVGVGVACCCRDHYIWSLNWDRVKISINTEYENHGKPLGETGLLDFRFKYESTMSPSCAMYTKHQEIITLMNEMHMRMNGKFITDFEFTRSFESIRAEMSATVYNEEAVYKNLYYALQCESRNHDHDKVSEYPLWCSKISLFFLKNITVEEFIMRTGVIPTNAMRPENYNFQYNFRHEPRLCFGVPGSEMHWNSVEEHVATFKSYLLNDEERWTTKRRSNRLNPNYALVQEYLANQDKYPLDI